MTITRDSLLSLEAYAKVRKSEKPKIIAHRRLRTVSRASDLVSRHRRARLLALLDETMLCVGSLELDLIDRNAAGIVSVRDFSSTLPVEVAIAALKMARRAFGIKSPI